MSACSMSGKTDDVRVTTMEYLTLLEYPRLTCPGRESNHDLGSGRQAV
jgi:hypothetical protein